MKDDRKVLTLGKIVQIYLKVDCDGTKWVSVQEQSVEQSVALKKPVREKLAPIWANISTRMLRSTKIL